MQMPEGLFWFRARPLGGGTIVTGLHKPAIPVGVIFSTTGSYRTVGREMLNGALLAIEEVNANPAYDFAIVPQIVDPGGAPDAYRIACENLLREGGMAHIIGCYTSSSRKEIIPVIEKFDALLWYPSHYEGFESCGNVIYGGAAPNQHIVPLALWALPRFGARVYCVGSNYIWPWENNRIMRAMVRAFNGAILREKYLPVGAIDMAPVIEDVEATEPDFIFNTLIGESSYAFYRAYHRLGERDARFAAARRPVTSCSLSEPELLSIGEDAAIGHIASSVYFQSIRRQENARFVTAYQARFGASKVTSADAEASYNTALLLAASIKLAGSPAIEEVRRSLYACCLEAPQGPIRIDPENNHCYLTPRLGRATANGQFDIFWEEAHPTKPDPYLVSFDPADVTPQGETANRAARSARPNIRLVEP